MEDPVQECRGEEILRRTPGRLSLGAEETTSYTGGPRRPSSCVVGVGVGVYPSVVVDDFLQKGRLELLQRFRKRSFKNLFGGGKLPLLYDLLWTNGGQNKT